MGLTLQTRYLELIGYFHHLAMVILSTPFCADMQAVYQDCSG